MLGHRELTMEDYLGILKRRFWLILASAILFLGIGIGLTYVIPPQYVSKETVLVEQQKVPENYVKPVVTEDLGGRLASMSEQIESRPSIEPIIVKYNLFAGGSSTMDDRIDRMRKAISITTMRSDQIRATNGMPGFFISFKAEDAHTAQQVCAEITGLFIGENLKLREQSAEGTTDFLKQQLADSKRDLDEKDSRLAAFQQKYLGSLPEQETSNTNTLQALTTQLDAVTQSLGRMHENETFLQAMISQQTHELQDADPATGISVDEREKELKRLIAQKQELETLYTPGHPDVLAVSRRIADLQAEIAHAAATPAPKAASAPARPDPPQLLQLKAQLSALQSAMANTKAEQVALQKKIRAYESRIESTPAVEAEYKQLTRDHETAVQFHNSLLAKTNESSMATALEQRQESEQFRVIEPANLPDEPIFPNPPLFAGGGLAFGLFLGLGIAGLLEYRDTSLRNERDIWAFTKLPTLAVLSHIDNLGQPDKPRRGWKFFWRSNKPLESAH
jgi:polysaccharide chain length determinant protein (PEP-CTERM system associated)